MAPGSTERRKTTSRLPETAFAATSTSATTLGGAVRDDAPDRDAGAEIEIGGGESAGRLSPKILTGVGLGAGLQRRAVCGDEHWAVGGALHLHVEAELLIDAPEPAAFGGELVGRDPHDLAHFLGEIVGRGAGGHAGGLGAATPGVAGVDQSGAGVGERRRRLLHGLQVDASGEFIFGCARLQ